MTDWIAEARARLDAITPGPWRWYERGGLHDEVAGAQTFEPNLGSVDHRPVLRSETAVRYGQPKEVIDAGCGLEYGEPVEYVEVAEADAAFIAAAPTDLRRAFDALDRVREACLSWEGAAKFMVSDEEAGKINAITNHILDVLDGRGPGGEPEVER